jgi:drug/metabolite transporter (DMT)-like permease
VRPARLAPAARLRRPPPRSTETSPTIGPTRAARLVTHASLLLTAALWGGNFAAMRVLLDELRPLDVVFVRGAGAAFFFALVLLGTRRPLLAMPRRDGLRLLLIGVLGVTILNLAAVYGQARLTAALASLIVTSNPIHTALISRVLLGEPLGPRKLAGIGLAFAGLVVVLLFGSAEAAPLGARELAGVGILAIAPFAWAFYTVLSKPLLAVYPSVHVAAYTTIAGAAFFLPLPALHTGMLGRIGALDVRGWLTALFVTLVSFVLAYILWYRGLRVLSPSQAAVYIYLVPVFGLLFAWLLLGERPTPFLLLGGATILAGVVLTNSAPREPVDGHATTTQARPTGAVH